MNLKWNKMILKWNQMDLKWNQMNLKWNQMDLKWKVIKRIPGSSKTSSIKFQLPSMDFSDLQDIQ